MTIKELNTKILIQPHTVTQNSSGDIEVTPGESWQKWAKVEQNSGNLLLNNGMTSFDESYKITMRYEASRPTQKDYSITYKEKVMKVYNVTRQEEGNAWFEIINAFTSN